MRQKHIDISIIVTLYNSGRRIVTLYNSLIPILSPYSNYEIILVDDDSKNNTTEIVKKIKEKDPHIRIIQLKRHMGQYSALFAGYISSRGEIVISLDDDAFEEIKYIPEVIKKIEDGYDIVFGWRMKNGYPIVRKTASFLFNFIISFVIGKRIYDIGSSLKAKNRRAVDKLTSLGRLSYFLKYIKYYKISEIRVLSNYSKEYQTRYSLIRLIKAAMLILKDSIFHCKTSRRKIFTESYSEISRI